MWVKMGVQSHHSDRMVVGLQLHSRNLLVPFLHTILNQSQFHQYNSSDTRTVLQPQPHPAGTALQPQPHPAGTVPQPQPHPAGTALKPQPHPAGTALQPQPHPAGTALQPQPHPAGTALQPHGESQRGNSISSATDRSAKCKELDSLKEPCSTSNTGAGASASSVQGPQGPRSATSRGPKVQGPQNYETMRGRVREVQGPEGPGSKSRSRVHKTWGP